MFDLIGLSVIGLFLYAMVIKRKSTVERIRKSETFTVSMVLLYFAAIVAVMGL